MLNFKPKSIEVNINNQSNIQILANLERFALQTAKTPEFFFQNFNKRLRLRQQLLLSSYSVAEVINAAEQLKLFFQRRYAFTQELDDSIWHYLTVLSSQRGLLRRQITNYIAEVQLLNFDLISDEFYQQCWLHFAGLHDFIMLVKIQMISTVIELSDKNSIPLENYHRYLISLAADILEEYSSIVISSRAIEVCNQYLKISVGSSTFDSVTRAALITEINFLLKEKGDNHRLIAKLDKDLSDLKGHSSVAALKDLREENQRLKTKLAEVSNVFYEQQTEQAPQIEELKIELHETKEKCQGLHCENQQLLLTIEKTKLELQTQIEKYQRISILAEPDISVQTTTSSVTADIDVTQDMQIKYLRRQLAYYKMRLQNLKDELQMPVSAKSKAPALFPA